MQQNGWDVKAKYQSKKLLEIHFSCLLLFTLYILESKMVPISTFGRTNEWRSCFSLLHLYKLSFYELSRQLSVLDFVFFLTCIIGNNSFDILDQPSWWLCPILKPNYKTWSLVFSRVKHINLFSKFSPINLIPIVLLCPTFWEMKMTFKVTIYLWTKCC